MLIDMVDLNPIEQIFLFRSGYLPHEEILGFGSRWIFRWEVRLVSKSELNRVLCVKA